jgi:hypothetical protein
MHLATLKEAREEALAAHEIAQHVMKERVSSNFKPWKTGDKVWLEGRNLKLGYSSRKLFP